MTCNSCNSFIKWYIIYYHSDICHIPLRHLSSFMTLTFTALTFLKRARSCIIDKPTIEYMILWLWDGSFCFLTGTCNNLLNTCILIKLFSEHHEPYNIYLWRTIIFHVASIVSKRSLYIFVGGKMCFIEL